LNVPPSSFKAVFSHDLAKKTDIVVAIEIGTLISELPGLRTAIRANYLPLALDVNPAKIYQPDSINII
jgi:hypothetical protein